ncbi:MAG: co-chaperone YbbN [Pseudomonadota bacterium]
MTAFSFDVTTENFAQSVLAASHKAPVLVDFWAPWCAPCRTLKPILEKLANEYQGKFLLAKVNSDEYPGLAMQYGVRGIPNVKAFVNGNLADEFSGALPEATVREFIERLLPSPAETLRQQALQLATTGNVAHALQLLEEATRLDPTHADTIADRITLLIELGRAQDAGNLISALPEDMQQHPRIKQLGARLRFMQGGGGDAQALRERIAANADDLDARLALANLSASNHDYATAFEQLLEIVQRNRTFQDDAGRKTMLALFEVLGDDNDVVRQYRRLLASALH